MDLETYDQSTLFCDQVIEGKRGPKGEHFKLQWMFPKWDRKQGWIWTGLEVKPIEGKGNGVFAKRRLPEGTMIPYLGRRMDRKEYKHIRETCQKHKHLQFMLDYVMCEGPNEYIDGNPETDGLGLRITSLINEPEPGYTANCVAKTLEGIKGMVVMICETIEPGEELIMYYGKDYCREYLVGEDAILPNYQPQDKIPLPSGLHLWKFDYLMSISR